MVYYVGYRFTDSNVCMKFNMGLYLHIDLLSVSTWIPSSFRPVANPQVTERHPCPMVDTGLGSFMYLSGSHIVTLLRFKEPIYA